MALEGTLSSSAAVLPGVARGTVLGPLLFLTYISDLPDTVQHSSARLFADDSLLYRRIKDQHDQAILQEDHDSLGGITHLANGIQPKQMQQHPHHAQQAQISSDIGYHLHGQTLETSVSKYPGITISSDLSWSTHVENVKDIHILEKVQRRTSRCVTNNYTDRSLDSDTSMLGNLKWSSLEQQRRQARLGVFFEINNGLVDINPACFFHHSGPRTRGAPKLHQERTQHHVFFHSFFPPTVSEWNLFYTAISSVPSLDAFLSRLGCSLHNLQPVPTSQ